jgi:lysozyme
MKVRRLDGKLAAALALVTVSLAGLVGCSQESGPTFVTGDVDELRVCATTSTLKGVDVSKWQGNVDFTKVAATGRAFAFARISDGNSSVDEYFSKNYAAIKSAGLVRGSYQFFRPKSDPIVQAQKVIDALDAAGGLKETDLPPVLDLEVTDGVSSSTVAARAKQWLDYVTAQTGKKPILYTAAGMSNVIAKGLSGYVLWVANYGASCPSMPTGYNSWSFWQYTDKQRVNGIATKVDDNYFHGNLAALQALTMGGSGVAPRSVAANLEGVDPISTVDLPAGEIERMPGMFEVPEGQGYMGASSGE